MQKAVHSMRLRSRTTMNRPTTDTTIVTGARPNGRSVLGDVSNKRGLPDNEGVNDAKKSRTTKKFGGVFNQLPPASNIVSTSESCSVLEHTVENKENGAVSNIAQDEPLHVGQKRKRGKLSLRSTGVRLTRSLSHKTSGEDSSSVRNTKKSRAEQESLDGEEREGVEPRDLNDCLIPEDFRLQRSNYDGINHTLGVAPHDRADRGDVQMATNYVTDLFQHLFSEEAYSRPRMYMTEQKDINARMRAILVDWLVEVHMKFRLVPETLYLCVNIIDRYCNLVQVKRGRLQLVGVTALLIACKYEEIYPPEVRDCVYITDRAYQRQEVLDMEQDMLQRLRFKITVPTAFPFLQRFLNLVRASPLTKVAANYYMERTLQEHDLLHYRPSLVCAAAVTLALNNPDIHVKDNVPVHEYPGNEATNVLLEYTGFPKCEIIECCEIIGKKIGEEPVTASRRQLVAVKRKYDSRKFQHVSKIIQLPSERFLPFQAQTPTTDRE